MIDTLLSGVLSKVGDSGIEKIASAAGVDSTIAKTLLSQAGPLIAAKMADNAKTEEGLASLDTALADHDGSVFDKIDDVVSPDVDTKGSSILGHIFGGNVGNVVSALSTGSGADESSTSKLLEMAAPLVLGQLGATKSSEGLDASGIFGLLQNEKQAATESSDSGLMNLAKNFLDQDNDGSVVDDLIGMAGKFLG